MMPKTNQKNKSIVLLPLVIWIPIHGPKMSVLHLCYPNLSFDFCLTLLLTIASSLNRETFIKPLFNLSCLLNNNIFSDPLLDASFLHLIFTLNYAVHCMALNGHHVTGMIRLHWFWLPLVFAKYKIYSTPTMAL